MLAKHTQSAPVAIFAFCARRPRDPYRQTRDAVVVKTDLQRKSLFIDLRSFGELL